MKAPPEVREWYAQIGRIGGKAKSLRKTLAARENGRKGGWPRGKPRKRPT